jgi:hypothetical protein
MGGTEDEKRNFRLLMSSRKRLLSDASDKNKKVQVCDIYFMRMKHHTLWYGVVGHFTYNLVILTDFWGGLN